MSFERGLIGNVENAHVTSTVSSVLQQHRTGGKGLQNFLSVEDQKNG